MTGPDAVMRFIALVLKRVVDLRPDITLGAAIYPTSYLFGGFDAVHLQFSKGSLARMITRPTAEVRAAPDIVAYAQFWADDMIAQMGP